MKITSRGPGKVCSYCHGDGALVSCSCGTTMHDDCRGEYGCTTIGCSLHTQTCAPVFATKEEAVEYAIRAATHGSSFDLDETGLPGLPGVGHFRTMRPLEDNYIWTRSCPFLLLTLQLPFLLFGCANIGGVMMAIVIWILT